MQNCCGNDEKERTVGMILNEIFNATSSTFEVKTIIYQTLIVLAFFALIFYSFFKGNPIARVIDVETLKKEE